MYPLVFRRDDSYLTLLMCHSMSESCHLIHRFAFASYARSNADTQRVSQTSLRSDLVRISMEQDTPMLSRRD